jgi:hypothetical protein
MNSIQTLNIFKNQLSILTITFQFPIVDSQRYVLNYLPVVLPLLSIFVNHDI